MREYIEYDNYKQLEWLRDERELAQLKADWEAWKVKNGLQDGRFPYAKDFRGKRKINPYTIRGAKR